MSCPVPTDQRAAFRDDGVVCVRGAFDAASLVLARSAFDWSLAHPSPAANRYAGGEGTFYQDLANPQALPAYRRVIEDSPAADVVAALWGSADVWFMYEQVFLKEGGENRRTPWHQDSSYLPIDGSQIAVVWISFDAVSKADSLEFVRGSHRGVMYDGSRFDPADDTAPLYGDGSLPRLPDIEAERARWDIVSWDVEPGDVLVFHPGVLHGGAPTHPRVAAPDFVVALLRHRRGVCVAPGHERRANAHPMTRKATCSAARRLRCRPAIRSGIRRFPRFVRAERPRGPTPS